MKHQTLNEIGERAEVTPLIADAVPMRRRERLERWAAVVERHPGRLRPLFRMENYSREDRETLRGDETPLAFAYADPVLRAQGLAGDTLGDAIGFFELSHGQAHRLLCDCHYLGTMTGPRLAARLRAMAKGGLLKRVWSWATASNPA